MKLPILLLVATCLPVLHLLGNEDLYTKSCRIEQGDPFTPDPLPPKQFTDKELQQIKSLERQITALLEISLQRLNQQLAVLDETPTTPPADKTH